ncbi:MAG: lipid-A-disaccharide synthase [Candidatus Aminicenantales bacterium]
MTPSILIVAGENSGDQHGARLVQAFRKHHSSSRFIGIGGKHMASEGVDLLYSVEDLGLVGIFEVLSHLPRIRKMLRSLSEFARKTKPDAAVLIDSPDFNLRLAKKLNGLSIPILYYISPTVWAWRKGRLKTIKRIVHKMLLIFPFEESLYQQSGIPAVYVGHPLKEIREPVMDREDFLRKYALDGNQRLIAILPGSRRAEIQAHMPVLCEVIRRLEGEAKAQHLVLLADPIEQAYVLKFFDSQSKIPLFLKEDRRTALAHSDLALAACGTSNLEAALLRTPVVAFYRLSPLTYLVAHRLVKIPDYSIVNILAGKKVIPELIQKDFTPENLLHETRNILWNQEVRETMLSQFEAVDRILGDKSASENAAAELAHLIEQDSQS